MAARKAKRVAKKRAAKKRAVKKRAAKKPGGAQQALLDLGQLGGESLVEATIACAEAIRGDWNEAQREAERWPALRDTALARHAALLVDYPAAEGYMHRLYAPDASGRRRELDALRRWDEDAGRNGLIRDDEPLPSTTAVPLAIILDFAHDPADEVRAAVAGYLGALGWRPLEGRREAVLSALERLGEDASEQVLRAVAQAQGRLGAQASERAPSWLVTLLESQDEQLVREVRSALIGMPGAVEPLRELLRSGCAAARRCAADVLGVVASQVGKRASARPAIPDLVRALDDHEVQLEAAHALGAIRQDDGAVPALVRLLGSDAQVAVRAEAARALGAIERRPDEVVPALVAALDEEALLDAALGALKAFKRAARPALPCLRRLQKTAKGSRADLVRTLLERLGEAGPAPDAQDWFLKAFDEFDPR